MCTHVGNQKFAHRIQALPDFVCCFLAMAQDRVVEFGIWHKKTLPLVFSFEEEDVLFTFFFLHLASVKLMSETEAAELCHSGGPL